jgi:plasmid stability protein
MSVLTVKNLDPEVLKGLAQRAESEGCSVQELARETLARAAALPAIRAQLAVLQSERTPMSWDAFEAFRRERRSAD